MSGSDVRIQSLISRTSDVDTIRCKQQNYLQESVAVWRARAGDFYGPAVSSIDGTVTVSSTYMTVDVSSHNGRNAKRIRSPVGFTPAWKPRSGTRFGSTSLLTGTDVTEATKIAARGTSAVVNFMF